MKRSSHFVWLLVPAFLALTTATTLAQGQAPPAKQPAAKQPAVAPAASVVPTNVKPIKGTAVINILKPVVKVQGNEVVTTIKVRNMSVGSIAGLRIDEYWYDKGGNVVTGDTKRWMKPVMPQEIVTIELRTPKDPKMDRNSYQFSHANGKVQVDTVKKF
jgi:hypothetical protein